MPYITDERLKSYLDTNQLHREQMCLAILSLDKRFSDVRPRHPRGGPDGGRDIEAVFRGEQRAYAAVGFVNQADDSEEKKRHIRKKFSLDLTSALEAASRPSVFVFMTNVALTVGEKEELSSEARAKGISFCEIFDRERLRIALDGPDGFSVRFQYLGIPLSPEEQATFFAKWGDDINSVIATGFQKIQHTLDQLLFLQEATGPLSFLSMTFELDRTYTGEEIGHFRAFCSLQLKEPKLKLNIFSLLFGASDLADRFQPDLVHGIQKYQPGIQHGFGGGQWEQYLDLTEDSSPDSGTANNEDDQETEKYEMTGRFSSIGSAEVHSIAVSYSKGEFIRFEPVLSLRDLDEAFFLIILNRSLAQRVKSFQARANGYKLLELTHSNFYVVEAVTDPQIPVKFSEQELSDPWVFLRPNEASVFTFQFSEDIPKRMYESRLV